MHRFGSLGEMLTAAAESARDDAGYRFLDGEDKAVVPFRVLARDATRGAARLQEAGLAAGDRVIVTLPTGRDFAVAFYAVVLCGAVPCVLPAPGLGVSMEGVERVQKIATQIGATRLIARAESLAIWLPSIPAVQGSPVEDLLGPGASAPYTAVDRASTDIAYIQATSGSTGIPKCVALTHGNILANLEQIGRALRFTEEDVLVSWLPLFHDMGLIGSFLMTTYWRFTGVFMSPFRFLRSPAAFLRAISDYGGTSAGNPTFAYALATSRVRDDEIATLDLSRWTKVLCGSEQVCVDTLLRFHERFKPCGFQAHGFVPCYGLAEASLAVTMHPLGEPLRFERVHRTALVNGVATPDEGSDPTTSIQIVDCGNSVDGTEVEVRGESGEILGDGIIGRIWVTGPSVMHGYYNLPSQTEAVLRDGWLDTGDLGYLRAGRLFITGRHKDLVIIRGQKWLPTDFEAAAAEVFPGRVVAFGILQDDAGTEGLQILCEEPRKPVADLEQLRGAVHRHVAARTGIIPAGVDVVPRNSIPYTTSGKLQRSKARQMFLDGEYRTGEQTI